MGHISKRGDRWRAEVCLSGKRKAKTFDLKREAQAWVVEQEEGGILDHHTFAELIDRYMVVATKHKGSQSEISRLNTLLKADLANRPLEYIDRAAIAGWRDERLKKVAPTSVRREMITMAAMFKYAINELGWMRYSPMATLDKPSPPPARRRGIAQTEIDDIVAELDKNPVGRQVSIMFQLSIETGMRMGELLALTWMNVREKSVSLFTTKNGDSRDVPLSQRARELIEMRRGIDPLTVFTLNTQSASACFRRTKNKTPHKGVHFHDARSEAVTRLSKRLDILQLAKVIGHRDIKSLMFYYAESADSIADRL